MSIAKPPSISPDVAVKSASGAGDGSHRPTGPVSTTATTIAIAAIAGASGGAGSGDVAKFGDVATFPTKSVLTTKDDDLTTTTAAPITPTPIASFEEMGLSEGLLRGIFAHGFEKPTPIQALACGPALRGHDVLAQAQSGTGKTGAFLIPMLQHADPAARHTQGLILVPTRELAQQIATVATALSRHLGVVARAFYGGTSTREDVACLTAGSGVQIVIATPGRALDLIQRRALTLTRLKMLVLDEADVMFEGFDEQVLELLESGGLPDSVQVAIFSATMLASTVTFANRMMAKPVHIMLKEAELTLEGIRQFFVDVGRDDFKLDTLCDLYDSLAITQSIVYASSIRRVRELATWMTARDFSVSVMHSELTQSERDAVMKEFRSGTTRVLIATDVLARGIDVQTVSHVINYDMPRDRENYLHRIGRTGRHGRKGLAITLATPSDAAMLHDIERFYRTEVKPLPADLSVLSK